MAQDRDGMIMKLHKLILDDESRAYLRTHSTTLHSYGNHVGSEDVGGDFAYLYSVYLFISTAAALQIAADISLIDAITFDNGQRIVIGLQDIEKAIVFAEGNGGKAVLALQQIARECTTRHIPHVLTDAHSLVAGMVDLVRHLRDCRTFLLRTTHLRNEQSLLKTLEKTAIRQALQQLAAGNNYVNRLGRPLYGKAFITFTLLRDAELQAYRMPLLRQLQANTASSSPHAIDREDLDELADYFAHLRTMRTKFASYGRPYGVDCVEMKMDGVRIMGTWIS